MPHMEKNDTTRGDEKDMVLKTPELDPLARIFRFKTKPRAKNFKRSTPKTYDNIKSISEVGDILLSLSDMRDERSIDEKSSWCKLKEYGNESLDRMWKQDDDNGKTKARTDKKRRKQRLWSVLKVLKLVQGVSKYGVGKWMKYLNKGCVLDDERVAWYYWYFVSGRVTRTRSVIVSIVLRGVSKCGVWKWVEMQKLFFKGSPRSSVDLKQATKSAHGKVRVRWDSLHTSILKQTTPSGTIYLMMKESCCRYAAKVTKGHYYEYLIPLNEESLESRWFRGDVMMVLRLSCGGDGVTMNKYRWNPSIEIDVRRVFNKIGSKSFSDCMSKARKKAEKPEFMNQEGYNAVHGADDALDAHSGNGAKTFPKWIDRVGSKNGTTYGVGDVDEYVCQLNIEEPSAHNIPNVEIVQLVDLIKVQQVDHNLLKTKVNILKNAQEAQSKKLDQVVKAQSSSEKRLRKFVVQEVGKLVANELGKAVAEEVGKATQQMLDAIRIRPI
nr:1,3-beta-glucan synthase subunit FKS1-like, domain-1 [Tanacetum cinerariifolium]